MDSTRRGLAAFPLELASAGGRRTMEKASSETGIPALWRRFTQSGDPAARERLVLAYSPLVNYVAGRMARALPAHVDEADLISYGVLGLISAIDRFDPSRNIKFETYAAIRIKGSIVDELRAVDWVPRSVRSDARSIERASARLTHRFQRTPRDREIADELGVPIKKLHESRRHISRSPVVALDKLCPAKDGPGNSMSLIETIQDPLALDPAQALDAAEMRARLADAIAGLPEKEKVVVALYFYKDLTLREIGEVLCVTESRVSQIRTKAMLRLKARLEATEHVRPCNRQNADPTCRAALPERRRDRIAAADGPHGGGGRRQARTACSVRPSAEPASLAA